MFLVARILFLSEVKNGVKLEAGSMSSGSQIMVGKSGLDPGINVPLSFTSVVLAAVDSKIKESKKLDSQNDLRVIF